MPANTAHGYPYPLGTDPVADGDDSIRSLAEKVEANLKGGIWSSQISVTVTVVNTAASSVVTFPVGRFATPPHVVATAVTADPKRNAVAVSGPTAASVTVYANNNVVTGALQIFVLAVEP